LGSTGNGVVLNMALSDGTLNWAKRTNTSAADFVYGVQEIDSNLLIVGKTAQYGTAGSGFLVQTNSAISSTFFTTASMSLGSASLTVTDLGTTVTNDSSLVTVSPSLSNITLTEGTNWGTIS
jgi:hypothetical protein